MRINRVLRPILPFGRRPGTASLAFNRPCGTLRAPWPCLCVPSLAQAHEFYGKSSDSKHRDHRARRPWQDHAGRLPAASVRHLRRARENRRASHGLERHRKGTRHHDPGQELRHRIRRHAHQHRRHARARRLRRRSGTRVVDGRHRVVGRRCRRRPDAADAFRHAQGAGARPQRHRGREQDRPSGRAPRLGRRPDLRAVRQAGRHRSPARFPRDLRLGARRLGQHRSHAPRARHARDVRSHPAPRAQRRERAGRAAAVPDLDARLQLVCRTHRHRPHPPRHAQGRPDDPAVERQRRSRRREGAAGAHVQGPDA